MISIIPIPFILSERHVGRNKWLRTFIRMHEYLMNAKDLTDLNWCGSAGKWLVRWIVGWWVGDRKDGLMHSFVHSFMHSFTHSIIHSFIRFRVLRSNCRCCPNSPISSIHSSIYPFTLKRTQAIHRHSHL